MRLTNCQAIDCRPFLITDLALDHQTISGLGSIFSVLGMFSGIYIATVVLRTGLKRLILLGMLAISLSFSLLLFYSELWLLYSLRILEGPSFILVIVAASTLVQVRVRLAYKIICHVIFGLFYAYWHCHHDVWRYAFYPMEKHLAGKWRDSGASFPVGAFL